MNRTEYYTMTRTILSLLLLMCLPVFPQSAAKTNQAALVGQSTIDDSGRGWEPVRLDLEVAIRPETEELIVTGRIRLRLGAEASLGPTLQVLSLIRFEEVLPPSGANGKIDANDAHLAHIRFSSPMRKGDEVEVSFKCVKASGRRGDLQVNNTIALALASIGWHPFPLKPMSAPDDAVVKKAPGRTTIHMPTGWRTISNGHLIERRESEQGTTDVWEVERRTSRSVVAARYETLHQEVAGRSVDLYFFAPNRAAAEKQGRIVGQAVAVLEKHLGHYPYPKLALVDIPNNTVNTLGISESGIIVANIGRLASLGWEVGVLGHEVAHGWWGNLIQSTGSGRLLLTEGMAQYLRVLVAAAIEGADSASERLSDAAKEYPWERQTEAALSKSNADNVIKTKGVWVYHMLRQEMGEELFFATLRRLIQKHADGWLSLDDFRSAFLTAAPSTPTKTKLARFFAQWIDRNEAPIFDVSWSDASKGRNHQVAVVLRQPENNGAPFQLRLEVAVDAKEGTRVHTIAVNGKETRALLACPGVPTGVRLDPKQWLFIWRPEYGRRP